ncbi:MAG TPA: PadR family transcriptional regulator [Leifsonia sp.]|nr:PadR family transcriptional regulator [Leifsonia sp.]
MSLRYALLALLTAQPMTGYDLARAFHSSVGHVWHAPDSQIYPELRRMESEGMLRGEEVAWGQRGIKTRYSITDSGVAALREWMTEPLTYTPERDPAHLRAAYLEWTDPAAARAQLERHAAHYRDLRAQRIGQLESIRDRSHPIVARRLEAVPEREWRRITAFKEFTYEGLVGQAEREIEWAERGLHLIDELSTRDPARWD